MDEQGLQAVVDELQPLIGGRVQRVDVVAEHDLVIELRCPGRTLRLLLSTAPGLGRLHLVERRPPRVVGASGLQGRLRKRLVGRPLCRLAACGRVVHVDVPGTRVVADLGRPGSDFGVESCSPPPPAEGPPLPDRFERSEAAAATLGSQAAARVTDQRRRRLLEPLRVRLEKRRRLLGKLAGDRAKLERLEQGQRWGDLLKPHVGGVGRGRASIEVMDWAAGVEVSVPLEPALDGKGNLTRYYARAKKARRGLPIVAARVEDVAAEIAGLEQEILRIESADPSSLTVSPAPVAPKSARARAKAVPEIDRVARRFTTKDGYEVRVGKGAKENDRLTLSVARGHDVWLHARGMPGAHVLLRLDKGRAPTQAALLDAAHLAAYFSDARGDARVDVLYTQARNVRKVKGAAPGSVNVAKEKTMRLQVDPARLDRLLDRPSATRSGGGGALP